MIIYIQTVWEQRKLSEVVKRITRKNNELESSMPLTISAQYGLIAQTDFFSKSVASRDVSDYYLIKNGDFAYNKSYSNGYPLGAIKRLDNYEMGVLSTLYIIFKPTNVDSNFLTKYYDSTYWHREVSKHAAEGARNHGLLNIAASDFFKTDLYIPSDRNEQVKIGHFLTVLENAITLHQRKLDKLKDLKQAYLQQMFPSEGESVPSVRFTNFNRDWELCKFEDLLDKENGIRRGPFGSALKKEFFVKNSDFVVYEQQNAIYDHYETRYKITEEKYNELKAFNLTENDFIMSGAGTIGRISKVPKGIKPGVFNQALIRFRIECKRTDSEYFIQFMRSEGMQKKLTGANPGSAITNLVPMTEVKKWEIVVPQIEEQVRVGKFLKKLDKTITLHQHKLESLNKLKQAYLQKMFI